MCEVRERSRKSHMIEGAIAIAIAIVIVIVIESSKAPTLALFL